MSLFFEVKPDSKHKCDDCGDVCRGDDLNPIMGNLNERLEPGGVVPSGECRKCGALSYPYDAAKPTPRQGPEPYPECAKLAELKPTSDKCAEFIEWLERRGSIRFRGQQSLPKLLGKFFEIDETKLENERRAMLEEMRTGNRGK